MNDRSASANTTPRGRGLTLPTPPRQRSRRTNCPLSAYSLKTARGRRIADLAGSFAAAAGNPTDPVRQAQIVAAAELAFLCEEARGAALQNPATANFEDIVRLENAAARALRALGIKPGAAPVAPKAPSIHEIAARHRANGDAGA